MLASSVLEADEATRVANVYAQAVASSQANMEKLSYSMRYAGPVAASFGHTIEETVGTLMALYNAGLRGSQAGITLRRTLQTLSHPTGEAKKVLAELGLTVADVHPEVHSLAEVIALLTEGGITSTQAMRLFGLPRWFWYDGTSFPRRRSNRRVYTHSNEHRQRGLLRWHVHKLIRLAVM